MRGSAEKNARVVACVACVLALIALVMAVAALKGPGSEGAAAGQVQAAESGPAMTDSRRRDSAIRQPPSAADRPRRERVRGDDPRQRFRRNLRARRFSGKGA